MPIQSSSSAPRDLRTMFESGMAAGLTDDQLLRTYLERRGEAEAAFAALVDRHGPMVWGVCRRALGTAQDAEDAFQATFLILARRADAIRTDDPIGGWLHGVASRVAARVRADGLRRRAREARAASGRPTSDAPDPDRDERLAALDEELARLPEKYRSPMVLCHLDGLTYAGAADRLGCSPVAVKGRLARGLELLRARLGRRGLSLPIPAVGGPILPLPGLAVPPAVAKLATSAAASAAAVVLAKGVLRAMFMTRLIQGLAVLAPTLALAGAWLAPTRPEPPEPRRPPPVLAVDEPQPGRGSIVVPLPPRDDLRALLRRAADEAIALASKDPQPCAGTLATIAQAQARAGDLDGARTTFAVAVRAANGDLGGLANFQSLLTVGQAEAEAGLRTEAGATFRRAFDVFPAFNGDDSQYWWTLTKLAELVKAQAGVGNRAEARRVADRLEASAAEFLAWAKTKRIYSEDVIASALATALTAVDDFEGAFRQAKAVASGDRVVGEVALAAAKSLGKDRALRYVDEATTQLATIKSPLTRDASLQSIAEAQALLGDFEAARATARSITAGANRIGNFGPEPWTWAFSAMLRVAEVQRDDGKLEAARETLREAGRMIADHSKAKDPAFQYQGVALAQIQAGDVEGALRSVEVGPKVYGAMPMAPIARGLAMAGRDDEARKLIGRALAHAKAIPEPAPKPEPVLQAKAKPSQLAPHEYVTFGEFQVFYGTDPNPIAQPTAAGLKAMEVAEVQALAGDTPGALATLHALAGEADRRFVLTRIIRARATAGDAKGALDLATKEARTDGERRSALDAWGDGIEARLKMESP